MINRVLMFLSAIAGAGGYWLTVVIGNWILILTSGIALAVLSAATAVIGGRIIAHREPSLAVMLIQGWRVALMVTTSMGGTVVGLIISPPSRQWQPDPTRDPIAFIAALVVPALANLTIDLVGKYDEKWFAYRCLRHYRNLWTSQPIVEPVNKKGEKGKLAWKRANRLSHYEATQWTLRETECTLCIFKDAIEAKEAIPKMACLECPRDERQENRRTRDHTLHRECPNGHSWHTPVLTEPQPNPSTCDCNRRGDDHARALPDTMLVEPPFARQPLPLSQEPR